MRLLLMGPPGAGKGTQAKRLVDRFGFVHLSSGDIFRAEKAGGSELGQELARYMDAGDLVPDDIVVRMMAKAIAECSEAEGLMLDGFPRTVPQAEALDAQLTEAGTPMDAVVEIRVPDEALVERITGRRTCSCGQAYHVRFLPPRTDEVCDACGRQLVQRDDDKEEVVRERLKTYHAQTQPVIEYYKKCPAAKVIEVDGAAAPDEVTESLVAAVEPLRS